MLYSVQVVNDLRKVNNMLFTLIEVRIILQIMMNYDRFANESFRQLSVRQRIGSFRQRPAVSSPTS